MRQADGVLAILTAKGLLLTQDKAQPSVVMKRLHQKGFIRDPRGKTESVVLTAEGLARSKVLFEAKSGKP